MLRYCTVKLYPTDKQKKQIQQNCHAIRYIYNFALDLKQTMFTEGDKLSGIDIINTLPQLKQEKEWLKDVDAWSLQNGIRNLDDAFNRFFKKQTSKPKFKKKPYIGSGSFKPAPHNTKVEPNKIKIPKVGSIKMRGLRDEYINKGKYKSMVIKHNPDNTYTASLLFELDDIKISEPTKTIGIDLGIKIWIQESIGKSIYQVDLTKEYNKLKKREQKRNRKQKNSNKRKQSQIKMNKTHKKINNKKKDQIEKITSSYKNTIVVHENIKTSKMYNNRKKNLNKNLQQQNWHQFLSTLKRKTKTIEVEKAYTSKECSCCHSTKTKRENQSEFSCTKCGLKINADLNAAINILNRGLHGVSLNFNELVVLVSERQNLTSIY